MKTINKYTLVSSVTALAVVAMSLGALSFAQSVNPLVCSLSANTVGTNQVEVLTATGGNGTFYWSGPNLSVTNSTGNQFAVSYPNAGTYPIVVTSAGLTATCNVVVTNSASTGSLFCSPAAQNVILGQTASVSASGGNGSYTWSAPGLNITNPTGTGFSANYASSGLETLTVTSAGLTATCAVNVLPVGTITTPVTPVTTPSLPDTGGGFGQ